jgi:hypothetical protein
MTVASRLLALIAFITIATPARAADDPRLIPKPREITVGELIPLSRAVSIDGVGNDDDPGEAATGSLSFARHPQRRRASSPTAISLSTTR